MKKFLVLFLTPVAVLEKWMDTDPTERQAMESKMQKEWQDWMETNKESMVEIPSGAGKTKVITPHGVADTKNDIMLYGVFQAESHEAVTELFVGHPHLQIPEASIQVMAINPLTGLNQ